MLKKNLLIKYKKNIIQRGQVLKCKNKDNKYTSLMVCEVAGEQIYQLLVISGYKAGLNYCYLPKESIAKEGFGLSCSWLVKNWSKWGYQDCPIDKVFLLDEPLEEVNEES